MRNIEQYTLYIIYKYLDLYRKYLKDNKGSDIDFPNVKFKYDQF